MSRYTQSALARKFERIPVKDKKGNLIRFDTIRRAQPLPAAKKEVMSFEFKGQRIKVYLSPGQRINQGRELKRQGFIKYRNRYATK